MVQWDVLDAECDEETRQAGDVGSLISLYEVVKLAYLQPDDYLTKLPQLCASAAWGRVAVALDSTLFVFNEGCSSMLLQMSLEAQIDLVFWIPEGEFIIVGDNDGRLQCVHISSQRVIITKTLPMKKKHDKLFAGGGCRQAADGTLTLTLITTSGHIIRMENIDIQTMCEGVLTGDIESLKNLEEHMIITTETIDTAENEVSAVEYVEHSGWVWCNSTGGATLWIPYSLHNPSQPLTWSLMYGTQYSRIVPFREGRYVVTLSTEGQLGVLCAVTGLALWEGEQNDPPVLDIVLIHGLENHTQFLLLLRNQDDDGCLLRIVTFPEFGTVYELEVSDKTTLVNIGEGTESITFLEPDISCVNSTITNLKLKSIVDGVPETRLSKLLMKRRFKEAEEFCNRFHLDLEEVHKARTKYLCDLMNPWLTSVNNITVTDLNGSKDLTEELMKTLDMIQDAEFVTSLCIEAQLPDISTTKKILGYAKKRLANTTKTEEGDQLSTLMQRVSESSYRLQTFEGVFPSSDIHHWLAFSHTDMLEEFTEHLSRGNLDVASTVWHRHQYEFSHKINPKCVAEILEVFPCNIPSAVQCNWLAKNFLSDVIRYCPNSVDIIAAWADTIVKNLEMHEKAAWPTNGLELANTVITVLNNIGSDFFGVESSDVKFAAAYVAQTPSVALQHLHQTALALQDLKLLAKKFRIKLQFNHYMQENKALVVGALLDCLLCGEEVRPLMEGFLQGYMVRHELDQDSTLARYIYDTLSSSDHDCWAWQEAPWEDKLYAVIHIMSDAQVRVECMVECLRVAPVPWSDGTKTICNLGLSLKTNLSDKLEDQRRLVSLKFVLRRYSIGLNTIDDALNGEMMLKNIVSSDRDTAIEDALVVVTTYKHLSRVDAYYFRVLHLLKTRKSEEAKNILCGLSTNYQENISQQLILYASQTLLITPIGQTDKELHRAVTEGIVALESFLKIYHKEKRSVEEKNLFTTIHNIYILQAHYNLYPTLRVLESKEKCKNLLSGYVRDWYSNTVIVGEKSFFQGEQEKDTKCSLLHCLKSESDQSQAKSIWDGLDHLLRLTKLLNVSRGHLLSLLASLSAKNGRFEDAINLCQEIIKDPTVEDCTTIVYEVVKLMVEHQQPGLMQKPASVPLNSTALQEQSAKVKSYAEFFKIINELICSVLITTHPDLLETFLELVVWCRLAQALYTQCHVEDLYTHTSDTYSSDPYSNWKFSPVFTDACMPVEENCVTEVLAYALEAWLESHDPFSMQSIVPYKDKGTKAPVFDNRKLVTSLNHMICHLRDRGQDLLALSLTILLGCYSTNLENGAPVVEYQMDSNQVLTLVFKALGSAKPDLSLALCLLLLLTKKNALKVMNELIKKFGYDYGRLVSVGTVGRDYCTLLGLGEPKKQFETLLMRAQWGKRLGDMNISFKDAFRGNAVDKVIQDLVSHPDCSFSLLHDYCIDFKLEVTDALLCYLKETLHSWSPTVSTEDERPGCGIKVDPPRAVLSKCQTIISEVDKKSGLYEMLETQLNLLSPYNYELIEFVLQQLLYHNPEYQHSEILKRGLDLIDFLKGYVREAQLSDTEVDEWISNYPQSPGPPDIAKYRLPFHALFNGDKSMKAIVEAELSLSTVDVWLQVSNTIKTSFDHMCLIATKNTVTRALVKDTSVSEKTDIRTSSDGENGQVRGNSWQLYSSHSALLAQVYTVVRKMRDYKLAVCGANWMVNRFPPGADKMEAAKKTLLIAEEWLASTSESQAEMTCSTIRDRYQQLAIEHTLHKYNLAQPQYLALARTPVDLVTQLYQHPMLHSLTTLSTHTMPDINTCVTEVCNIAACNRVSIQLELLEKWLPPPESAEALGVEETVTNFQVALDPGSTTDDDPSDDSSLFRVIYLLWSCPQEESVSYLLNCALSEDSSISAVHRLRALRCLLAIADERIIQKYYPEGIASIRSLLQTLTYVSRLEGVGHATNVHQFISMNKAALVEGLWRSQRHNPIALHLISDICYEYKVKTASLWGAVLTQINNFVKMGKMEVSILERVLLQTKGLPHLWVIPALSTAWTTLLQHPFMKANNPVSQDCLKKCVHSVDLLLRHCPVMVAACPLIRYCQNLNLSILALSIAAADQLESHDLQSMVEEADLVSLKASYNHLKITFAFPKRVEDILEQL